MKELTFISCAKWLTQFFRGVKKNLLLFYIGSLFDTIAGVIGPILLGIMINQIVYHRNIHSFLITSGVFLWLTIMSCVMHYLTYEQYSYFWNEYTDNVRLRLFAKIQRSDAKEMSNANYGDMVSMLQWQTSELVMFYTHVIVGSINAIVYAILAIFMIFRLNVVLGVVVLFSVPSAVFVSRKLGRRARKYRRANRKAYTFYVGWLFELVNSFQDIILLCAEEHAKKLFNKMQKKLIDSDVKAKTTTVMTTNMIQGIHVILQMVLFSVIAVLASKHILLIGSVVMVLSYYSTLTSKIKNVTSNYMWAQAQIEIAQKYYDYMERDNGSKWKGKDEILGFKGKIEFENVSFSYNSHKKNLWDFNLIIEQGEKIALVGESGCGKTTLAYMLIGFYTAQTGKILIDDRNIQEFSLHSLREEVGVVQQEVLLFPNTIRENILLGNKAASDKEIMQACKLAGIDRLIETLEDGLDTYIGKGGRQLSGGQKQRLSIARIYLKNPSIIVFDEATSALDSETEQMIHSAWQDVLRDRTSIVIAHRLSSVLLCDRVAIMEQGKIVETGVPNELMENSSRFRALFAIKEGGV